MIALPAMNQRTPGSGPNAKQGLVPSNGAGAPCLLIQQIDLRLLQLMGEHPCLLHSVEDVQEAIDGPRGEQEDVSGVKPREGARTSFERAGGSINVGPR